MGIEPTTRFSNRVVDYVRSRPGYPDGVLAMIGRELRVEPGDIVADLGAGTGIFSECLLAAGYRVIAVEPNEEMLQEARARFGNNRNFSSRLAVAEETGLADHSVGLVTAAQAFHWFDPERVRREALRILRPGAPALLVWNERRETGGPAAEAYQQIVDRFNTDLAAVNHRRLSGSAEDLESFFSPKGMRVRSFFNRQRLDLEGLIARIASSSYMPAAGDPRYADMVAEITQMFKQHAASGTLEIVYDTRVFTGVPRGDS